VQSKVAWIPQPPQSAADEAMAFALVAWLGSLKSRKNADRVSALQGYRKQLRLHELFGPGRS